MDHPQTVSDPGGHQRSSRHGAEQTHRGGVSAIRDARIRQDPRRLPDRRGNGLGRDPAGMPAVRRMGKAARDFEVTRRTFLPRADTGARGAVHYLIAPVGRCRAVTHRPAAPPAGPTARKITARDPAGAGRRRSRTDSASGRGAPCTYTGLAAPSHDRPRSKLLDGQHADYRPQVLRPAQSLGPPSNGSPPVPAPRSASAAAAVATTNAAPSRARRASSSR